MLHISLALVVGIGFVLFGAAVVAAGAFALARWEGQPVPASVRWGFAAFAGALTLGILVLTLITGAAG
ncbi:hypothetical protein ACFFSH_00535 [Streptomyces filamentosus]|uniref:Uncharacterized protein n=1 Tax=Streptomyces filamentosus TaxID=67294 RepID=A0A919EMB6_STRFL|nr:hypothetical protein [Streptomyces filamentosus]GHF99577.1 hypothetical protein GCM10017667_33180 [Streptomyces filamentosus]